MKWLVNLLTATTLVATLKDQLERYLFGLTDRMKNAEVADAARKAAGAPP